MGTAEAKENPSIPTALCGRLVPGQGCRQPAGEDRAHCSSPGKARHPRPNACRRHGRGVTRGTRAALLEVLKDVEKSRRQPGRAGSASQPVLEHLCHAAAGRRASRPRCQLRIHFLSSTDQICRIPASCKLLGSKQGQAGLTSNGAGLEEEPLPGSRLRHRGAGTAPRPTPASAAVRAAGNEPHWETGHRAFPRRAAGGQPGDGDDSRAAPLLPTGAQCESSPSPRALLGSAAAAFDGGERSVPNNRPAARRELSRQHGSAPAPHRRLHARPSHRQHPARNPDQTLCHNPARPPRGHLPTSPTAPAARRHPAQAAVT